MSTGDTSVTSQRQTTSQTVNCFSATPRRGRTSRISTSSKSPSVWTWCHLGFLMAWGRGGISNSKWVFRVFVERDTRLIKPSSEDYKAVENPLAKEVVVATAKAFLTLTRTPNLARPATGPPCFVLPCPGTNRTPAWDVEASEWGRKSHLHPSVFGGAADL